MTDDILEELKDELEDIDGEMSVSVSPPILSNDTKKAEETPLPKKEEPIVKKSQYVQVSYNSKKVLTIPFLKFYGGPVQLPFNDASRKVQMTQTELGDLQRCWGKNTFVKA